MIPDYPWFGPRHGMGWGWAPISWEGKVLCALVAAIALVTCLTLGRSHKTIYVAFGLAIFMVVVAALTGTGPG